MEEQDWVGKVLDKDILVSGNKVYSPATCAFVSVKVNLFVTEKSKEGRLSGVYLCKDTSKFRARVYNLEGKCVDLGRHLTEEDAHLAWGAAKNRISCELADGEENALVAAALRKRYSMYGYS